MPAPHSLTLCVCVYACTCVCVCLSMWAKPCYKMSGCLSFVFLDLVYSVSAIWTHYFFLRISSLLRPITDTCTGFRGINLYTEDFWLHSPLEKMIVPCISMSTAISFLVATHIWGLCMCNIIRSSDFQAYVHRLPGFLIKCYLSYFDKYSRGHKLKRGWKKVN